MTISLSQTTKVLLIIVGALLLAMMLFYPPGYDQAAFNVGGELVFKKGAVPYRDFLDTKPPFIFYIYGFALWVFGHHDWSIRAFDIIYHFFTLFFFFKLVKKWSGNETAAYVSTFFYVILYTASGYWATAQAETFALLPSLLIINATEKARRHECNNWDGILIGLCAVILVLLKQTLVFVPIASATYLLTRRDAKTYARFLFLSFVSFILLLGSFVGYMYAVGGLDWWLLSMKWVNEYASISPLLSAKTIHDVYYLLFPSRLVETLSLSFIIFIFVFLYKRSQRSSEMENDSGFGAHLLLQLSIGLLSILFERKCFPYHFSRIFFAAAPLIAFGFLDVVPLIKQRLSERSLALKAAVVSTIIVLIFYSPFLHVLSQPLRWTYLTITGADIPLIVQELHGSYPLAEEKIVVDNIGTKIKAEDEVFFWGNTVGIYFYLDRLPRTIVLTNTPLITSWTPQVWRTKLIQQLHDAPPRFFIVEQHDAKPYISGTDKDSWQQLLMWSELNSFVQTEYSPPDSSGNFLIFERRTGL